MSEPLDVAFARFQARYPAHRRKGGYQVMTAFVDAVRKVGIEALFAALENHLASEDWQTPKYVPSMDTWFRDELWVQEKLPAQPKVSAKTQATLGGAAAFLKAV